MDETVSRYQEAIQQAHSAAWDQDWDRAVVYFRAAVAEKPSDPNALSNLALSLFETQEYSEALSNYLKVIELTPNDPVPMEKASTLYEILKKPEIGSKVALQAAELYFASEDINKALENWSRSVAMNPENIVAHSRLAVVYERLNKLPQAVGEYIHIASLMQHAGEREKAIKVLNRALKLNPNDEEAVQALIMIHDNVMLPKPSLSKSDTTLNTDQLNRLLDEPEKEISSDLSPVDEAEERALKDLAGLFFEQGNSDDLDQKTNSGSIDAIVDGTGLHFKKNIDRTKIRLYLGDIVDYLSKNDINLAENKLEQVIDIGLHHPAAFFYLGLIRANNDRVESAIRNLRRAVSHKDYALGSRLLLADCLQKKGDSKSATIEYMEALKLADCTLIPINQSDDLQQMYIPLIEALKQSTSTNGAKTCETISDILLRPDWRQHIRDIRKELYQFEDGIPRPIAEVLTETYSNKVMIALGEIGQLAREGRRIAAIEEAFFALSDAPTYLPLHISIAELLLSGNQIQSAVDKFLVIARSYGVKGETDRAIDMLKRVLDISPMNLVARQTLIDQLFIAGLKEDAVKEYIKLAEVYFSMAELSESRKTYLKALRFAEQARLGESLRIQLLHYIADVDVQSLNWRQGLTVYKQILAIKPNEIEATRNLIDLNFRLGERRQALSAILHFVDTLNSENRGKEVASFLEKIIEKWPEHAIVREYLADQYIILDRSNDAVDQLEKARQHYFEKKNKEASIHVIRSIIELRPANVTKYIQLLERIR